MRHKNIRIEFVPKSEQRYDTLGDWMESKSEVLLRISTVGSIEEQFLVALHELVEWRLCATRGIFQKTVDDFDFSYQGDGEPGDDPAAPYRVEHRFAMLIEHLTAHELGLTGYGKVE
jgi:hypothetical protein